MAKSSIIVGDRRRENLFGVSNAPGVPLVDRRKPERTRETLMRLLVLATLVLVVVWTVDIFVSPHARFATNSPKGEIALESASALARLFAVVVLFLFPLDREGERLRWVAGGLLILALSVLVFGTLLPVSNHSLGVNAAIYASVSGRILASVLFVIGLIPAKVPRFSQRVMAVTLAIFAASVVVIITATSQLPSLIHASTLSVAAAHDESIVRGLTGWHWFLSLLAFALALVALAGAAHRLRRQRLFGWLLVAMILLAASQLHNVFWPTTFSGVVTTADVLRLGFAIVLAVGGLLELRHIAAERSMVLAAQQEESKRLAELAVLRSNFTSMVAHELGSPLAAIRGFADMLATRELKPDEEISAIATIQKETDALRRLVTDVQASATVELDDFAVELRPTRLAQLLVDAASFVRSLPGEHPLKTPIATRETVWADPGRVGQVLRNLLTNAAKYSLPGTPIEIRLSRLADRLRIEVVDGGFGIGPDDLIRIFDKFGRGRDELGHRIPGVGLGLYLSRRIVRAHGSDLTVQSTPGNGSVFGFDLEVIL